MRAAPVIPIAAARVARAEAANARIADALLKHATFVGACIKFGQVVDAQLKRARRGETELGSEDVAQLEAVAGMLEQLAECITGVDLG